MVMCTVCSYAAEAVAWKGGCRLVGCRIDDGCRRRRETDGGDVCCMLEHKGSQERRAVDVCDPESCSTQQQAQTGEEEGARV